MKQLRLHSISDNYFDQAWELYEAAFPPEERRLLEGQIQVMKKSDYHFDIMIQENEFIGFLLWWDFETVRYVAHFATAAKHRNKGYGQLILEKFMHQNEKSVLLEVELPYSTINKRRITFYERTGFRLNEHYYEVPPLIADQKPLQLLLMSYPTVLSAEEVEQFIRTCHPIIFED